MLKLRHNVSVRIAAHRFKSHSISKLRSGRFFVREAVDCALVMINTNICIVILIVNRMSAKGGEQTQKMSVSILFVCFLVGFRLIRFEEQKDLVFKIGVAIANSIEKFIR